MTNPIIKIVSETGEELERPMTKAEFDEYKAGNVAIEAFNAELKAKAEAKQAVLTKLGITAEEAEALLG